jgi:hypothetical protein
MSLVDVPVEVPVKVHVNVPFTALVDSCQHPMPKSLSKPVLESMSMSPVDVPVSMFLPTGPPSMFPSRSPC